MSSKTRGSLPVCLLVSWITLVVILTGCTNEDARLVEGILEPVVPGPVVSLAGDVQPIFTLHCATSGCHTTASAVFNNNLNLEEGALFDPPQGIVGVSSLDVPALLRVEPFNSDDSYLIHKLEGTHRSVGGFGSQMPLGALPLGPGTIQVIRDWIDEGARDN